MSERAETDPPPPSFAAAMLDWYDAHRRDLPWRVPPGRRADPYRVWLSEIMLQQTTVATVKPYFAHFLSRWPDVSALAAAELDEVLTAWQGLGYYARARNLHRCAREVAGTHGGRFPQEEAALRALPGIGAYTAAAVAAIAFGCKATPVDGNIERVMARFHALEEPLPAAKPQLKALAEGLTPARRAGDFAQALMDLGATVCTPKSPDCGRCPLRTDCLGRARGLAATLPRKSPRKARPLRHGVAFWLGDDADRVLLRRRPEDGLLGGMMEPPSTPWREAPWTFDEALAHAPRPADWRLLSGVVTHGFTHFRLELRVCVARLAGEQASPDGEGERWQPLARLGAVALPTAMKKIARHALARREGDLFDRRQGEDAA